MVKGGQSSLSCSRTYVQGSTDVSSVRHQLDKCSQVYILYCIQMSLVQQPLHVPDLKLYLWSAARASDWQRLQHQMSSKSFVRVWELIQLLASVVITYMTSLALLLAILTAVSNAVVPYHPCLQQQHSGAYLVLGAWHWWQRKLLWLWWTCHCPDIQLFQPCTCYDTDPQDVAETDGRDKLWICTLLAVSRSVLWCVQYSQC